MDYQESVNTSPSSRDTSLASDTTISSHDESQISKASKKQRIFAKMSIRRDKAKKKVLRKRQENLLSMADFFNKQEEFKLWLFEQKSKNANTLTSSEQKMHFKKFIKLWNKRKLAAKYLHGPQTPPSTRRLNRFSLIEDDAVIKTPDLLDFREPVDLSLACTPATPMSTFGKSQRNPLYDEASTPKRPALAEVNFTPVDGSRSSNRNALSGLRKSIFDNMTITSPINKYTNQTQQNREAAVISEGQTCWKDLMLSDGQKLLESGARGKKIATPGSGTKLGELELEDLDGSPYSMMRYESRANEFGSVADPEKLKNALDLLDQSHSPYSRMRPASQDSLMAESGDSVTQSKDILGVGKTLSASLERDCNKSDAGFVQQYEGEVNIHREADVKLSHEVVGDVQRRHCEERLSTDVVQEVTGSACRMVGCCTYIGESEHDVVERAAECGRDDDGFNTRIRVDGEDHGCGGEDNGCVGVGGEDNGFVGVGGEDNGFVGVGGEDNRCIGVDGEDNGCVGVDGEDNGCVGVGGEDNGFVGVGGEDNGCIGVDGEDNGCVGVDGEDNGCVGVGGEDNRCIGVDGEDNGCLGVGGEDNRCIGVDGEDNGCVGVGVEDNRCIGVDGEDNRCVSVKDGSDEMLMREPDAADRLEQGDALVSGTNDNLGHACYSDNSTMSHIEIGSLKRSSQAVGCSPQSIELMQQDESEDREPRWVVKTSSATFI